VELKSYFVLVPMVNITFVSRYRMNNILLIKRETD